MFNKILPALLLVSTPQLHASLFYTDVITTGGAFTQGGSWSGNGTVEDFDSSDDTTYPSGSAYGLLTGFNSGTLGFTSIDTPISGTLVDMNITVAHTFIISGGNANLAVNETNSGINRLQLTTADANVTSISLVTTFSSPLHARNTTTSNSSFHPWLGSARYMSGADNDANLSITNSNIQTVTALGSNASAGIDGTVTGIFELGPNVATQQGDTIEFISNNLTAAHAAYGIKHVELAVAGSVVANTGAEYTKAQLDDSILTQGEQLYSDTSTIIFDRDAGASFASGSEFYFTFDGYQGLETYNTVVPEPSAILLLNVGLVSLLMRRKARRA
ncbi:MAG: PEP-CTERM sorting domain-containing protein [Verrucomicrobiae bacterium]|nr:PEP-CTERM sorting domain-containing protein [Verrucomicrobiae bacterium]NNJ42324.1 PEP-CTERM sorting domain-containing protein [Akkermansiaceae bacterium]